MRTTRLRTSWRRGDGPKTVRVADEGWCLTVGKDVMPVSEKQGLALDEQRKAAVLPSSPPLTHPEGLVQVGTTAACRSMRRVSLRGACEQCGPVGGSAPYCVLGTRLLYEDERQYMAGWLSSVELPVDASRERERERSEGQAKRRRRREATPLRADLIKSMTPCPAACTCCLLPGHLPPPSSSPVVEHPLSHSQHTLRHGRPARPHHRLLAKGLA
jgi:hypothetical protein